ncbi:MAG: glycosyltransferase family 39 protein [Lacisediminihabitans sp.]
MTTTIAPRPLTPADQPASPRRAPGIRTLAAAIGAFATLLSFVGSWIPSLWGDEAASVMSAERPLPSLFTMLGHVDAVHGLYYFFLHGWIQLFGASDLSVRFPSAIGAGLAAAGTVVLGDLVFSRRVAILAGLIFAILPRVTFMGAEARSYALATAIGVWLTVLLVVLLQRRIVSALPWLVYGLGFGFAIYSFLYLILLGLVHAIVLLSTTRSRAVLRRWLVAVTTGIAMALPVLVWGLGQHEQIAFLGTRPKFSPNLVFISQWFGTLWFALLCWTLIIVAITAAMRTDGGIAPRPNGVILATAWLVLPTLLLETGNALIAPMYSTRYLSFSAPAAALLVAVGISTLSRNWMRATAIVLLLGVAAPNYLSQRGPYAKDGGSDWKQLSAVIGLYARPGDAIVFDNAVNPSQRPRLAMHLYPADYRGLDDIALVIPYAETSSLRDVVAPLHEVTGKLATVSTVWAVEMTPVGSQAPPDVVTLKQLGFRVLRELPIHRTTVYELSRETS